MQFFLFSKAKVAVEVIEAIEVIMCVEVIDTTEISELLRTLKPIS
jgi:hypothetical protein